jgi:hypothetical protein
MNDADFEMLARESGGAFDAWLRSQALGHAIIWLEDRVDDAESLTVWANRFYYYMKGEVDGESNLHGQK